MMMQAFLIAFAAEMALQVFSQKYDINGGEQDAQRRDRFILRRIYGVGGCR